MNYFCGSSSPDICHLLLILPGKKSSLRARSLTRTVRSVCCNTPVFPTLILLKYTVYTVCWHLLTLYVDTHWHYVDTYWHFMVAPVRMTPTDTDTVILYVDVYWHCMLTPFTLYVYNCVCFPLKCYLILLQKSMEMPTQPLIQVFWSYFILKGIY